MRNGLMTKEQAKKAKKYDKKLRRGAKIHVIKNRIVSTIKLSLLATLGVSIYIVCLKLANLILTMNTTQLTTILFCMSFVIVAGISLKDMNKIDKLMLDASK